MSTQDVVNTGSRKATSRRVKFGATLEDLEGRVLLSSVHHAQVHRAAHVQRCPFTTQKRSAMRSQPLRRILSRTRT